MLDEQADFRPSVDVVGVIFDAFQAALREEVPWEQASQIAASLDLAREATPESVARLSEEFIRRAPLFGAAALRLADLIKGHASALNDLGRTGEALPLYEAIRPVFEQYAQPLDLGFYHASRAHVLATCGQQSEAAGAYDDALPLLQRYASPSTYALALKFRGNVFRRLGRIVDAVASYDAALPLLQEHDSAPEYTWCLMNQIILLIGLGRMDEAEAYHSTLSRLGRSVPTADFAQYFVNRANALEDQNKLDEAVAACGDALPLLRQHSSAEEVALCLASRARLFVKLRKFAEAVADFDDALPFFRQHGEPGAHAACLMSRADALKWLNRLDEAVADYDDALRIMWQAGANSDQAACFRDRAGVLKLKGELTKSLTDYKDALVLFQQDGDAASYALCLMYRAEVFEEQGDLAAALADYNDGLPLLREHGRSMAHAWYIGSRVNVLDKLGRLAEAEAQYDDYLALEENNSPANLADTLANRAQVLHEHGHLVEAVARYNSALFLMEKEANVVWTPGIDMSPKRSPQARYADCLVNRANALRELGMLSEAMASYDAALPVYEKEANSQNRDLVLQPLLSVHYAHLQLRWEQSQPEINRNSPGAVDEKIREIVNCSTYVPIADYAQCLMYRALTLYDLGKFAESVAGYDVALPVLMKLDELEEPLIEFGKRQKEDIDVREFLYKRARAGSAYCMLNKAIALRELGDLAEAVAGFDEVLPLLQRKGDLRACAFCILNRATALQQHGQLIRAMAGFDEALALLRQHSWPADSALCLMNRASVLRQLGRSTEALTDYSDALPVLKQHGPPTEFAKGLMDRASTLVELGLLAEAVVGFRDARGVLLRARRLGRIDETSVEFSQRWGKLFNASVSTALAASDGNQAYQAVCDGKAGLIGDLRHRLQLTATAEPALVCDARAALTNWMRNNIPQPPPDSHPLELAGNPFLKELEQMSAERDRRTKSYLAAWGRHHHGYDPQRTALPVEGSVNRNQVQECLPMDWVLLDFWRTGEEEFTVFILFRDAFHIENLPFPRGELQPKLERMIESLYHPRRYNTNLDVLGDLHHYLFSPLLPLLRSRQIGGLYLVPQDFLHLLPLHAARSTEDGSYLCDEFAVAFLPSAALLPQLPKPDPTGPAFVLANPEFGTEHSLPFAQWEGLQLAQKLGLAAGQFHLGVGGTLAATEAWVGAGLVHFSCHGSGDPEFAPRSHLRLADELLLAHDVIYRRPPLKEGAVVILNGCQTSRPDTRAVNEGLGLMTAFLVRGAGLVLATQWNVDDACAAQMALQFVEELRIKGTSPAQALKRAQQYVRQLTITDIAKQDVQVEEVLPVGSPDLARLKAHRARTYLRAGLLEEAMRTAEVAIPVLRRSGMEALAERLLTDIHGAMGLGDPSPQQHLYESPLYWGAFQLIGRVT